MQLFNMCQHGAEWYTAWWIYSTKKKRDQPPVHSVHMSQKCGEEEYKILPLEM